MDLIKIKEMAAKSGGSIVLRNTRITFSGENDASVTLTLNYTARQFDIAPENSYECGPGFNYHSSNSLADYMKWYSTAQLIQRAIKYAVDELGLNPVNSAI